MYTLYLSKGSSALAAHILMEELGVDYTTDERPIPAAAHLEPDFLAINPKGRVPALRTPDGILTENPAILWYLGERHPEAGLLPSDPFERARLQELNAYICATVHIAFAHKQRGHRWSDDPEVIEAMKPKVAENMRDCAAYIENHALKGDWVLGDAYSVSDPYLFLVPRWLNTCEVDLSEFPRLEAHFEAMKARPATKRAMAGQGL